MSIISNLPQTGSLERHRILSESLRPRSHLSADRRSESQNYNYNVSVRRFLQNGFAHSVP